MDVPQGEPRPPRTKAPEASEHARKWSEHRKGLVSRPEPQATPGTAVCPRCHLIAHDGAWHAETPRLAVLRALPQTHARVCPSCLQTELQEFDGVLTLTGPGVPSQAEAILAMARHLEARIQRDHPLQRLVDATWQGDRLVIRVVGMTLAKLLGPELVQAFHGTLKTEHASNYPHLRGIWLSP